MASGVAGVWVPVDDMERARHADGGGVITVQPDGGIDDEVERLRGAGVEFTGGTSDHPWGRIAPFEDSECNDLQFYAPPA